MTVEDLIKSLSVLQAGMSEDLGSGTIGVQLDLNGKGKIYMSKDDETLFNFKNLRQLNAYLEQANG